MLHEHAIRIKRNYLKLLLDNVAENHDGFCYVKKNGERVLKSCNGW